MADISKVNGVAFSSIGGMNGVAKASIASLNGLSAPSSTVAPVVFYDAKNASSYGGSGTTWSDLKSGGYDMTLTNGPVFTSGTPDHFDFDGVNDIAVNNSNGPQIFGASSAYSFEAWVRLDGLLSASSTTPIYSIASKSSNSNALPGWKWTLRSGYFNGMMLRLGESGATVDITPSSSDFLTAINDTTDFHQVVITVDESTATAFVYADGTQYSTTVISYSGGTLGQNRNNTNKLCLARYADASSSFEFNGDISEVAIYDKVLSQAEVTALYNAKAASFGISVSSFSGILDTYTGSAAAYSTRRLAIATTILMRVRRDSDDAELDIGFDSNGDLDSSAIATFAGSANAFVVTWTDQSGNSNNATQSTSGSQPKIYDGSAVITENGKPALDFDGTMGFAVNLTATFTNIGIWSVHAGTDGGMFGSYPGSFPRHFVSHAMQSGFYRSRIRNTAKAMRTVDVGTTIDTQVLQHLHYDRTNLGVSIDGGTLQTITATVGDIATSSNGFRVGGSPNAFSLNGSLQELLVWNADQSSNRSAIEGNINAHYQIGNFGTPTSGLLATYTGAAVAYSVRQLANTATKSMRIVVDSASSVGTVNSSDPQYDIGFDANGDLDTAAIVTACNNPSGTNYDAYVVKWYDQASVGGTNDAANSGYTTLPKIAEAGVVITENGEPAIEFGEGGNAKILEFDANMAVSLYYSVFAVRKGTTANGQMFLATQDDNRYWADLGLSGNDKHLMDGFNGDNGDYTNEWARYRKNGSAAFSGITTRSTYKSTFYNNNQLLMSFLTEGTALNRSAVTEFCIGAYQGLILPFQGTCQEFIMWQDSSSNQSSNASSIESNMTTHFSIS